MKTFEIACRRTALAAVAMALAAPVFGAALTVDRVRQRYPWNGLVDIDYTITLASGDAAFGADDNLEVQLVDRDVSPAVTNRAVTFLQAPLPMTAGSHRITWDANADGISNRIDTAKFVVKVVHYSAAYMVIDVSGGSSAKTYPVDFLNGAPPNGFNVNEYKSDKIVLRRIHAGSYVAGSPTTEANRINETREKQHRVALSNPFYIGIFSITQKQYLNVVGGTNPSRDKGDYRPVHQLSYDTIRGDADTTSHQYEWPWTDAVSSESFMGKLLAKCKSKDATTGKYTVAVTGFDLPTEFQWEYACRAGTTNAVNTTNAFDNASSSAQVAQLDSLGRHDDNVNCSAIVGSYLPNMWGLYDMHGNVFEWCLDYFQEDVAALGQIKDPKGPTSGQYRLLRGGAWGNNIMYCRSATRHCNGSNYGYLTNGFRLCRNLP